LLLLLLSNISPDIGIFLFPSLWIEGTSPRVMSIFLAQPACHLHTNSAHLSSLWSFSWLPPPLCLWPPWHLDIRWRKRLWHV
jgi:hypothetical protein